MSDATTYPITASGLSFVRFCERHESELEREIIEREIVPSVPQAIGGVAGLAVGAIRLAANGLGSVVRTLTDWVDGMRFPETKLLGKLPKWQADATKLLDELMAWQRVVDENLKPMGVQLQGKGVTITPYEQLPMGYAVAVHKYLDPSGGDSIIDDVRPMLKSYRAFFTRMLQGMGKAGAKASEEESLPEGIDIEALTAELTTALDALEEVVASVEEGAAALAEIPVGSAIDMQAGVKAVVTPLNQVVEVLADSLIQVDRVLNRLATEIPAGLPTRDFGSDTSFMGFGRPQRRAARRYSRGLDPKQADRYHTRTGIPR